MFADTAHIEIKAGKGGDGRLSFRREKYKPNGGPDGGDGGRGGNVVALATHNANTLVNYRNVRTLAAEDGHAGGENRRHGKKGEDIIVKLPVGTQVWDGERLVADMATDGQEIVLAAGGRGGFGNAHFVSSVRQAPRTAEFGEPGEGLRVRLELKLVADVGLVGQPNAGKSTLLSVITSAKPEIADYAFTTLVPNLGMVKHRDDSFLVADIPGLIEGASAGRGLGDEFLRHVERTAVLLQLVDAQAADVAAEWRVIDAEIKTYAHGLEAKPRLTVLTKIDMILPDEVETKLAELAAVCGSKPLAISAPTHQGLTELLDRSLTMVVAARERRAIEEAEAEVPVIDTTGVSDFWEVNPEDEAWRLTGDRLEGFARRTNFEEPDAEARLRDIFHKNGVWRELRRAGAQPGEILRIGDNELVINE